MSTLPRPRGVLEPFRIDRTHAINPRSNATQAYAPLSRWIAALATIRAHQD